jgi:signal transduction histidine kinase
VRNAVENTPDHGRITVKGENSAQGYTITVRDYGVGIPESEQANIFEGFYPIQETDMYSSGRRYAFNAGGTGTDLLKMKIFSQRFGFNIRFSSQRCSCVPTGRDICPGDITNCKCCETTEDCLKNGGTEFVIEIPPDLVESPGQE